MAKKRNPNAQDTWMGLHRSHGKRLKMLEAEVRQVCKALKAQGGALMALSEAMAKLTAVDVKKRR